MLTSAVGGHDYERGWWNCQPGNVIMIHERDMGIGLRTVSEDIIHRERIEI